MVRAATISNDQLDMEASDSPETTEKKKRKPAPPRQMVAIVTVDEEGKVNLEAASYNAATLLARFGELSRSGANPQILNIVKS